MKSISELEKASIPLVVRVTKKNVCFTICRLGSLFEQDCGSSGYQYQLDRYWKNTSGIEGYTISVAPFQSHFEFLGCRFGHRIAIDVYLNGEGSQTRMEGTVIGVILNSKKIMGKEYRRSKYEALWNIGNDRMEKKS